MAQQTFTFINHSGKLFDESLVYAGAVYGFDVAGDFVHAFSLSTDASGVCAKEVYYTGITMTGTLRGTDRSWIDFEGAGIRAKGERLSFNYTWCFKYPARKRYLWRMERRTRNMYLENSNSEIIATFKRCLDDDNVEGRLTLRVCPDLPLFMLILATCKLGLVRIQASDAGVPFPITVPAPAKSSSELTKPETASSESIVVSLHNSARSWLRQLTAFSKS
ncbi:hypothetical protein EV175_000213 [Coemansia sp. RSA 1933]|nr:hypothetical protein EV175_000213 [Coemansia sp. RSA 1933]